MDEQMESCAGPKKPKGKEVRILSYPCDQRTEKSALEENQ